MYTTKCELLMDVKKKLFLEFLNCTQQLFKILRAPQTPKITTRNFLSSLCGDSLRMFWKRRRRWENGHKNADFKAPIAEQIVEEISSSSPHLINLIIIYFISIKLNDVSRSPMDVFLIFFRERTREEKNVRNANDLISISGVSKHIFLNCTEI